MKLVSRVVVFLIQLLEIKKRENKKKKKKGKEASVADFVMKKCRMVSVFT